MRKQIAAANWKMNLTFVQAQELVANILSSNINVKEHQKVLVAVPFPYLLKVKELLANHTNFEVCAQNCAATSNGAFTGEVSAEMLKSIGINYVLIGHSERRDFFSENNEILKQKINLALSNEVQPIFCCGEPLSIREGNLQNEYVAKQLKESLFHLSKEQIDCFIIAYEPIWAIGTGKTATSEQAQEMHSFIRSTIAAEYGLEVSENITILYGGSVKASNAEEIFSKQDVDGGLVGGASLQASEFVAIIQSLK
jgi:triosephosphate isomerase